VYHTGRLVTAYAIEVIFKGFIAAMTLDGQHKFLLVTMSNDVPRDIVLDPIGR